VALMAETFGLQAALTGLADAFAAKGAEFSGVEKLGRTQLQDAVPMTLGQEFMAFANTLREDVQRLDEIPRLFAEVNLGGTAIGTGLLAPEAYRAAVVPELAAITGLPLVPSADLIESSWDTGAFVLFSGMLKRTATKLSKIANDLRLLSSGPRGGFGEITLPAMQPGSSIMPGKVNPVIPEAMAMVCAQVIGNHTTITVAGQSGNFQLNVMLPVVAHNLLQSIELLANASRALADSAIKGFKVRHDIIAGALERNPILVTALNPVIGYEKGAATAKQAYKEGRPIKDVARETTGLSKAELDKLLDPLALTKGGVGAGGSAGG
jgi:aspartate ammonia-lyase